MSKAAPRRPQADNTKRAFHIVASRFNAQYVDALVDHTREELRAAAPEATISLHRVPGAFEIPVVVRELASRASAAVINAVLSFDNEAQARARCLENKINRGTEAARAAVEIANVLAHLRNKRGAAVSKPPRVDG